MKMTFTHYEITQAIIQLAKNRTILGSGGQVFETSCVLTSAKGQKLTRITAEVTASMQESFGDFDPDKIPEKRMN